MFYHCSLPRNLLTQIGQPFVDLLYMPYRGISYSDRFWEYASFNPSVNRGARYTRDVGYVMNSIQLLVMHAVSLVRMKDIEILFS